MTNRKIGLVISYSSLLIIFIVLFLILLSRAINFDNVLKSHEEKTEDRK